MSGLISRGWAAFSDYLRTNPLDLLQGAVEYDNVDEVRRILDNYGQDIDIDDVSCGESLLTSATGNGNYEMCRLLLDNGANVNIMGTERISALLRAVQYGPINLCRLLIDSGADVNLVVKSGKTVIYSAASRYDIELCRLLIDSGAVVTVRNDRGNTPLHYVVCNIRPETRWVHVVELCTMLMVAGADPLVQNNNGESVIDLVPTFAQGLIPILGHELYPSAKFANKVG